MKFASFVPPITKISFFFLYFENDFRFFCFLNKQFVVNKYNKINAAAGGKATVRLLTQSILIFLCRILPFKFIIIVIQLMFLGINIFMPANINSIVILLDEAEHDIKNYSDRGQCYLTKRS